MKQLILSFQEVVNILEAAKIPCIVKRYEYESGSIRYSIEFGFNWPTELVEDVAKAFGGQIPSYVDVCGDSCGPTMTARKKIAGGQKDYLLWR